jgi:hypothetical protein
MPHHSDAPETATTKPGRRQGAVKRHHIAFGFGSLVAVAAGLVTLLDSWDKVLVFLHLKEDPAFVLAEQTAKGDLARQIVHSTSQREFWIRRFSGDLGAGFPSADQDDAWTHYNESVVSWNENYITNYFLAGKYFSPDVQKQLADINWIFRGINTCMNQIHYRLLYTGDNGVCHLHDIGGADGGNQDQSQGQNVAAIGKTTDHLDELFKTLLDTMSK